MERGELCRDRCIGLLLADCMYDLGASEPSPRARCADIGHKSWVW
ncbi:MAG: hypothetical protein U9Q37_01075 [Euryarchaeota archaeon]|nr:hypothetical protein [Euryarchaeota archaeon]